MPRSRRWTSTAHEKEAGVKANPKIYHRRHDDLAHSPWERFWIESAARARTKNRRPNDPEVISPNGRAQRRRLAVSWSDLLGTTIYYLLPLY